MEHDQLGIWHKTTVQQLHGSPQNSEPARLWKAKRSLPLLDGGPADRTDQNKRPRTADGRAKELPGLKPGAIDVLQGDSNGKSEYSQRNALLATPSSTADPLLGLAHRIYGLPPELVANFHAVGIKMMYPWQKQCLLGPGILDGEKNLVYSAPTGGGKSLVADLLMIKRLLSDHDTKAILVLPFVALVQEKVRWLRMILAGISRSLVRQSSSDHDRPVWRRRTDAEEVRVVGCFGGGKSKITWNDFDIAVCTIEKANTLVNSAIDDCSISDLRSVVLDELHMIDDGHRGYLLELLATKLLCLDNQVQIVGMSATLTNIELVAQWLGGHSYKTYYRPIPLREHLVCDGKIYPAEATHRLLRAASQTNVDRVTNPSQPTAVGAVRSSEHKELGDPVVNAVVALTIETVKAGYGVLVFSGSRAACEADARLISRTMPPLNTLDIELFDKRMDIVSDLRSLPTGIDTVLEQTIPYGVVFHHVHSASTLWLRPLLTSIQAGLTAEEREIVSKAYDSGVVKVCVATCSLAAGINLPARRVILHNAKMGRDLIGPSMLRQMRGRAGRKGKDEIGETYLCCRQVDLESVVELMHAELPQTSSCLGSDKRRLQRALLEVISIRLATSEITLEEYVEKTLLYHATSAETVMKHVNNSLTDLEAMKLITKDDFSAYHATKLGHAIVASALDPEDGIFIHEELANALRSFVMDGDMHVLYNFTPVNDQSASIDWRVFWHEMEQFDDSAQRVLAVLGLKRKIINAMLHGGSIKDAHPETSNMPRRYHRFYLALQLRDLCNEMPIHRVAQKYNVSRGSVQTLSQNCQGFAAGMVKFCEKMDWGAMAAALDHFSDRLRAGAKADLLALAKITFVKSRTARVFWENGFRSVAAIANTDPRELVPILKQAQPYKVRLEATDMNQYNEKLFAKATVIVESANRLWQIEMRQDTEIDE